MNISAKVKYACLAVAELAATFGSGEPMRVKAIAQRHGIPSQFLVQILLQLKAAQIVDSTRGAAGGYQLSRDPAELSLGEVMRVVDGVPRDACRSMGESGIAKTLEGVWQAAGQAQMQLLDDVSFSQLAEMTRSNSEHMYYI